jgi:hypothetical protein
MSEKLRSTRRLFMALALGLGLFLVLSILLGRATPNWAQEPPEPTVEPIDPIRAALEIVHGFVQEASPPAPEVVRPGPQLRATALTPDPRVAALMTQITTGTVVAYERGLTGEEAVSIGGEPYTIVTRNSYSGEPISQATRYVYEHFQGLGLDVSFHEYNWSGNHWRNVVAEQRGWYRPDEIYLITAHLDDMPSGSLAPGADDNASGSTAVLVAADLLSGLDCGYTLRFVLFSGEEQGLRGSAAYAADLDAAGENVRAVLNLDMIAYDSDIYPVIEVHYRSTVPGSEDIAAIFSQVVAAYELDLMPEILRDNWLGNYSDNRSFWEVGYPAILTIEDYEDFTPHYHRTTDRLATLNLDYFTALVRAGVGTFAHMGCFIDTGVLTGTVTALNTGLPLSATVIASANGHVYTATTDLQGSYSLTLPVDAYTVLAEADLPGYLPAQVTGVAIYSNTTTVQHFALASRPVVSTGLLTGTVTAFDTGLPLSATVIASVTDHIYTTTTDLQGYYSLTLPVATYTVRADADLPDYVSGVVTDVTIFTDATTVRHFALLRWSDLASGALTGTVTDLDTGLPLSATLTAIGARYNHPFRAETDAQGFYSLTLPVDVYTVLAEADLPGYLPAQVTGIAIYSNTTSVQHFELASRPVVTTGLLTGTVTALDTGLPLSATVTASVTDQAYTATTDVQGYYSLALPVDVYAVRAEADLPDYVPVVVTDVVILTDVTTVRHFALLRWSDLTSGALTGTVTDLDTGLPLSATLTAIGARYNHPFRTETDAQGFYSLTLPVDVYTVRAGAYTPGYLPAVVTDVAILSDTVTVQHFRLQYLPFQLYVPVMLKQR